jgi:DNA-binding NarL/FixJ family response regulator
VAKALLIADDNPQIRNLLKTFFQESDIHVCAEAVDGVDAVAKASDLQPDLAILDLCMPRLNGLDAARAMKTVAPGTRVILFTMYADIVPPAEAEGAGVAAVISKSNVKALISQVQQFLLVN